MTTLTVSARVARPGRSVELVEASLADAEGEVMRATAWRLQDAARRARAARRPTSRRRTGPADGTPQDFFPTGVDVGYHTAMEYRFVTGAFLELGPAVVWMRMRHPLVEGEEPSPLQRVLVAADSGNGVSAALDYHRYLFINTDLTVHLHRGPETEWVCLDAVTRLDSAGVGMSDTAALGRARPDRAGGPDAARAPTGVDSRAKGYAPEREDQSWGAASPCWRRSALVGTALAHEFDHAPPGVLRSRRRCRPRINAGGENARVGARRDDPDRQPAHGPRLLHDRRASRTPRSGTLAAGANSRRADIIQLTNEDGEVDPAYVFGHPSATCPGIATGVTGLQHDAEAARRATRCSSSRTRTSTPATRRSSSTRPTPTAAATTRATRRGRYGQGSGPD